jgi:hypothetical protein
MGTFTKQRATIQSNQLIKEPGTRNPVSGFQTIAEDVPCRVTGTHTDDQRMFILKKYYEQIPGGIHKGYKILVNEEEFSVKKEPQWAGGSYHHIELVLEEFN